MTGKGIVVTKQVLREAFDAAMAPAPPVILVSQRMIAAGRKFWMNREKIAVHVLLPELYTVMELERRKEEKEGK